MTASIAAWHYDHVRFYEQLARLRPQLDLLHRGERPDYEGMAEIIAELREYGVFAGGAAAQSVT